MPNNPRQTRKLAFLFTFLLTLFLSFPWVNAKDPPKPKPQPWHIDGIAAALDDSYPEVKGLALQKLAQYQQQDGKSVIKTEDLAQKAANVVKDEKVDAYVRGRAAVALSKLGAAGAKYVPDIANILKDEKVNASVRGSAAVALSKLGAAGAVYVPDILNFLKDEKVDAYVRGAAAAALGNLRATGAKYTPDIANILKDEKVDAYVRGGAAVALSKLGAAGAKYTPDIANILKDEKVDANVRGAAAVALSKLGAAGANYAPDIANFLNDENVSADVRGHAASALGNLGAAGAKYVLDIANILNDENVSADVRGHAASALGNLGAAGAKYVPDILNFLKDEKVETQVREVAAYSLGNLRVAEAKYVPDILNFLKHEKVEAEVRRKAAFGLRKLRVAGANYIPDILNFLKDRKVDVEVRRYAAALLGDLGAAEAKYVPDILNFLKHEKVDAIVRSDVAAALGDLGAAEAKYVPDILNFLKHEKVDANVRSAAAAALGNLGVAGAKYVPDIANILKDEKVDANVRGAAAVALSKLGAAGANYAPDIANFLNDENVNVRGAAAAALGNLGAAGAKYVPDILAILKDEKVSEYTRQDAAVALGNIRKLEVKEVLLVLSNVYEPNSPEIQNNWRFLTYFLGGGTDEVKTLLKWLGNPKTIPTQLPHNEGVKTLQVFKTAWEASDGLKGLRGDLAQQIAEVAKKVSWQQQDIFLLESHYHNLKKVNSTNADAVQSAIANLKGWQWFFNARNIILIHIVFWAALIFAYPKSPQIQAIFFWNPWVRRILGLGYVGFLLTWVTFLRRKLFEPFKPSLLADAQLDNFDPQAYFPKSKAKLGSGETQAITEALPSIKGQVVLQGDSGLGKSMFLRHLVKTSGQIVVYLPANKCDKGVIEAIQAKLHGQAQDTDFLKSLIYSGAIDICIDGLNQVTADTRAKIGQFVESYFRGNIIMTTQPLEWTPPSTAKIYYLQPLQKEQIEEFLISRQRRLPKDAIVQGADYKQACKRYLTEILQEKRSPQELAAAQQVLFNPMDLTLVALMLSQGKQPDLFHLQQQQYDLMAAEYQQMWQQEFPLKKFSQAVYQMRLNDEKALPDSEFNKELLSMEDEKYKMVVSRQWQDNEGEAKKEWYFRHDKIMDFFLVQNFLGESEEIRERIIDNKSEPRFRGVYFLLATLLDEEAAKELREMLIQYAADTKDHTVSDKFVQLLRSRRWGNKAETSVV
jgi:HEAT repeat protein